MQNKEIRIALVRLSALGDIVNTAIVVQFIKQHYPHACIDWITEEAFAPLLEHHSDLENIHAISIKRIKKEKKLSLLKETIRTLRSLGPYDLIIDMQGLLKSAITARLIGKNIHGYDRSSAREGVAALLYKSHSHIPYRENIIRRNCTLVADVLGFTISDEEILHKRAALPLGERPAFLPEDEKSVACVIGASWPSKQYPKERFAQLCTLLDTHCILIWGNEAEHADALWIAEHAPRAVVAPKMSLKELCALIEHVDLTIGNDTGPTHMAWALNRPSITLFGPTTPRMIFETPRNIAIESDSIVNITRIDKSDFSIKEINPAHIAQQAKELMC